MALRSRTITSVAFFRLQHTMLGYFKPHSVAALCFVFGGFRRRTQASTRIFIRRSSAETEVRVANGADGGVRDPTEGIKIRVEGDESL